MPNPLTLRERATSLPTKRLLGKVPTPFENGFVAFTEPGITLQARQRLTETGGYW